MGTVLPEDFSDRFAIDNAAQRFDEAATVAETLSTTSIDLLPNLDHAAIFTDPPHLVAGPLKELGYVTGWDARCYPSPVDGQDYVNVSARLPADSKARDKGWFDYVAVVHPVDKAALDQMLGQGYGNPFIHHLTWGIVPPKGGDDDDFAYAARVVPHMATARNEIGKALGDAPGTLIAALPQTVIDHPEFESASAEWVRECEPGEFQFESMQGGGFLIQFFVLTGGRVEIALRVGTNQTFNPKSVHKISEDEISTVQN